MRALAEWYHAVAIVYHDLCREWYEERGNPKHWHHRERIRYHSTKLLQLRMRNVA